MLLGLTYQPRAGNFPGIIKIALRIARALSVTYIRDFSPRLRRRGYKTYYRIAKTDVTIIPARLVETRESLEGDRRIKSLKTHASLSSNALTNNADSLASRISLPARSLALKAVSDRIGLRGLTTTTDGCFYFGQLQWTRCIVIG